MQQTEKYKLNLIESSDPFLPEGLNANTQKVEDVLAAREALSDEKLAEMDGRVTVLEGHKLAYGIYKGNGQKSGETQIIKLGFTPAVVWVSSISFLFTAMSADRESHTLSIVDGGFKVTFQPNSNSINTANSTYAYAAIL